ncbi:kinase-like domain-containing protein [Glomus cerebriforme]|uniref:Kinase-like domain-containing protein n=1 Tax=Glomus cerebriforme TaxID=658196 RepID=A0A397S466_9GLOM|nr:kinase-like domain-containing protein [Glomus cerebriforme]
MPIRQTWRTKVRGVLKLFNSSSTKETSKNEELEFTTSAIYSDDSDECNSDTEVKEVKTKRGALSIKSVSSDISTSNTISSKDLQECNQCGKMRTFNWCKNCESKEFIKHFPDWSSKNDLLDKFIRNTQYKAYNHRYYWEWIPFEKFSNIQSLIRGGQSNVFTAIWLEGPRNQWDNENMMFVRRKLCKVILKRLIYTPDNIGPEFINELRKYYGHQRSRCSRTVQIYGLTQDPKSSRYMLVTAYYNKLDIRSLLKRNSELSWSDKLRMLQDCAEALLNIHSKGHIHKNFHPGNLLLHSKGTNIFLNISDLGLLCNNDNHYNNLNQNNSFEEIIGVIPYVAPEVLNCWPYTQDSDIYSFSMLMYELATGKPPFYDRAHDQHLIFDICEGLRPQFDIDEIPESYVELMKQCWDTEPVNRPCANEILFIIKNWNVEDFSEMQFEIEDFEIHPDATYNSRPLGELISRELELQDQVWEETELSEHDDDMEGFSEEEEEENEEENDSENEHEQDHENNVTNSESDSENEDNNTNSESNSNHEDDQVIESKTNEFQLKLDLDFGESLSDSKQIDEVKDKNDAPPTSNENDNGNENKSDDDVVDDDNSNDDDDDDDSLSESSSTNDTNSPNTSVELNSLEEMKHEEDTEDTEDTSNLNNL